MSDPRSARGGVFDSIKRMADGVLALAHSRLELFVVELQMEKTRLIEVLILSATLVALGFMTLTMLTFSVVILFWESARMAVLILVSLAYLAGTVFTWRALIGRLKQRTSFEGTLGEMKKDRACLGTGK